MIINKDITSTLVVFLNKFTKISWVDYFYWYVWLMSKISYNKVHRVIFNFWKTHRVLNNSNWIGWIYLYHL